MTIGGERIVTVFGASDPSQGSRQYQTARAVESARAVCRNDRLGRAIAVDVDEDLLDLTMAVNFKAPAESSSDESGLYGSSNSNGSICHCLFLGLYVPMWLCEKLYWLWRRC